MTEEILGRRARPRENLLSNPVIEDVVNVAVVEADAAATVRRGPRLTRIGVVTFPGTLDDRDAARAVRLAGGSRRTVARATPTCTAWTPS